MGVGGTDCVWLAGRGLFFRRVSVALIMATDGGRPGWHHDWC